MSSGASPTATGTPADDQFRLRLRGLQHEVDRAASLARWLRRLAGLLLVLLIALSVGIYLYYIMQYATVRSVEAAAVRSDTGAAEIAYAPASAGKIEFVRESQGLLQTLTEYADSSSVGKAPKSFTWSSARKDEKPAYRVTHRSGLFLVTRELSLKPPK